MPDRPKAPQSPPFQHAPDAPWLIRTYAGHSTPEKSNALYRANLARGQTGLSIAFDLPTQTGYDCDHPLARGEVGKVGVPIGHLGDMRALLRDIPLQRMNTSMTINAPAPWLLALYVTLADEQGSDRRALQGTTQNDIIKEYLSRGTHIFPPRPSLKLTADTIAWCLGELPKWNAMNVCSYHLQEAGATPEQELAFALADAIAVLDCVRGVGEIPPERFSEVFASLSFFVNAGIRFVTELCKMRAFGEMWEEIGRERYGIREEKALRFRYGVQVNSLGLTEQQPENNVYRILLEALAVTLSKSARARALQLPAWNEALGLPREWDQQWSLRLQQILAFETDLLEFEDVFDGSHVIAAKVQELKGKARQELAAIEAMGGAVEALESGYMKSKLVESHRRRIEGLESGARSVIGVNRFTESAASPFTDSEASVQAVDASVEYAQIQALKAWREQRDPRALASALANLRQAASEGRNIMPASLEAARAGASTGEWAQELREVFGQYRAPTGVALVLASENGAEDLEPVRAEVERVSLMLGRRLTFFIGKPGLDGHSNGAEQIAVRARAVGMEAVYEGIRSSPAEIAAAAKAARAHAVGLSILSGSHLDLVREVLAHLRAEGLSGVPVIVGGIIPEADALALKQMGVARVYTPKDFRITEMLGEVVGLVEAVAIAQPS